MKTFVSLFAFTALTAVSSAVTITFDDLAIGTVVSNQYATLGTFVSGAGSLAVPNPASTTQGFASTTALDVTSFADASGSNAGAPISGNSLRSTNGWLGENGDPVFRILLAGAITSFSADFGSVQGSSGQTGIYGYNAAGTLVSSALTTAALNQTLTLSNLTGVTTIAFTPGSFNDYVDVDNITYTPQTVPEPASFAMVGLGALALVRRRRR